MATPMRAINLNDRVRRVAVDHRISLPYYYSIADNLLRQADIYREENNHIDLYIMLLRYSSLMCETIPSHCDYQTFNSKEKTIFTKRLWDVMNKLESLKPDVQCEVDELNKGHTFQSNGSEGTYSIAYAKQQIVPSSHMEQTRTGSMLVSSWKPSSGTSQAAPIECLLPEKQFQMLFSIPAVLTRSKLKFQAYQL